jgi:arylsulfatase
MRTSYGQPGADPRLQRCRTLRRGADPLERKNLAGNGELVLARNDKLNKLIDSEVGEDHRAMLPGRIDAGREVSAETMKGF